MRDLTQIAPTELRHIAERGLGAVESTLARVGSDTPTHSQTLPDWFGYRASNASSDSEHAQFRRLIAWMHLPFRVRWNWVACLQMGASGTALSFRWPDQQFE